MLTSKSKVQNPNVKSMTKISMSQLGHLIFGFDWTFGFRILTLLVVTVFSVTVFLPRNASALEFDQAPTIGTAAFDYNTVTAQSLLVLDKASGKVILSKNADTLRIPASITKLVTALVVLDAKPNFKLPVAMVAEDEVGGTRIRSKVGVRYTVGDLLHASLIASANNATHALARSLGLPMQEFVARMNAKAQSLGAINTAFVDPTGIDAANITTARDIAKIAAAAFAHPTIKKISVTPKFKFRSLEKKKFLAHTITNTNQLLLDRGVIVAGGKTGYLDESRYNFVTELKDINGKNVIVVLMGSASKKAEFNEAKQLATWAWLNYDWGQTKVVASR
jgi:serine-type D-Ala-D-Ala endopeptidase (penicillin-binding protein 7)